MRNFLGLRTPFTEKIMDDYVEWLNEPSPSDGSDAHDPRYQKYLLWREVVWVERERGIVV